MIKIERKDTEKARAAITSLENEKAKHGTYNTPEVNDALQEMFHGKCYICENKKITSYQIEHLIPHKGDEALKYDWNNLFLACGHCNNIKSSRYDPILDCTRVEVDEKIAFRKSGYFGKDETYEFQPLDDARETLNTVALLQDVYYGTTPQKKMESVTIRRNLREELSEFKRCVRNYYDTEGEDREDALTLVRLKMKENTPFVAFKRWLLRDNKEYYQELVEKLQGN